MLKKRLKAPSGNRQLRKVCIDFQIKEVPTVEQVTKTVPMMDWRIIVVPFVNEAQDSRHNVTPVDKISKLVPSGDSRYEDLHVDKIIELV